MAMKPRRKLILGLGIFVGLWDIFIGISSPNIYILIFGLASILLSFGFFMLWHWVIIPIFIFCLLTFVILIALFTAALPTAYQPVFAGVAIFLYSPQLFLCLLFIDALCRKEIRMQFKQKS